MEGDGAVRQRLPASERRNQIIGAAREVFSELGARGNRMRTIAERAGISEPILYRHFRSKEALYEQAVVEPLDNFIDALTEQTHSLAETAGMARSEILERFHALSLKHIIEVAPLLGAALFSEGESGRRFYQETLLPRMRRLITEVLVDVSGWHPDSLDIDITTEAMIGVYFGLAFEHMLSDEPADPEFLARQLTLLFAGGLVERTRDDHHPATPPAPSPTFTVRIGPTDNTRARLPAAERRENVLAAARDAFGRLGPGGARTKQIAELAGISEAFLFRLFDTKEQIYAEAVQRPLERGFAELAIRTQILGETYSGRDFIQALNRLGIGFFAAYGPLCTVALFSDLHEGRRFYRAEIDPHLRRIRDVLVDKIADGNRAMDPETTRRAIIGTHWAIGFSRQQTDQTIDLDTSAAKLTKAFLGGIRDEALPA